MEHFYKAWIANDDNEVEGTWEDWYTGKVEKNAFFKMITME